jgi:hypothetical protein
VKGVKDFPTVVRQLIELLREFHTQVNKSPEQNEVMGVLNDFELLDQLKSGLDNARQVVWAYRLSSEQGSSQHSPYALQLHRMQRIREMMGSLADQKDPQNDLRVQLFLHELQRIVSSPQAEAGTERSSRAKP